MNDSQSIEQKIKRWLDKNGYPLEMRVARKLAELDFGVTQSHYYEDFESGKPREIDVVSRLYDFQEPKNYVAIAELETFSTIECKSAKNPWVVFCETEPNIWDIEQALSNKAGKKLLMRSQKQLQKTVFYRWSCKAGHGVAQALGGNEDLAYTAVMSAIKAAEAKVRVSLEEESEWEKNNKYTDISLSIIVIPAVVISAPLFECRLVSQGDVEIREVQHSSLVFRYPRKTSGYKAGIVVHIISESALNEFLEGLSEFHNAAKSELESMIPSPSNDA